VRAAVLAAARLRLAAEGPGASLRDIARDADVNLGLLHRHFGAKDDLIRAVFLDNAESGLAIVEGATTFDQAIEALLESFRTGEPTYARMLAWMLLSGRTPTELQSDFPTIARLVELADPDRRPVILLVLLAMYSWQVFADQLLVALDYDAPEKPAVLGELVQLLADVVTRDRDRSSRPES
jgi:TetR/AcrR family transcriptional regulator, repressor for neighboring sulfatase